MPYVFEIYRAGNTLEFSKHYSSRWNKKGVKRSKRKISTKEEQREVNKRQAEKTLRLLLNENFMPSDIHLVLDYNLSNRPESREDMRADADDFLKGMRKLYKSNREVFKYIHVMEKGKKGALHHHLVINMPKSLGMREIINCWKGKGRTHFNPLDETGQYKKLASYLIKYSDGMLRDPEALQGRRWNSSHNLRKPKLVMKKVIKDKGWYQKVAYVPKKMERDWYLDKESVREGIHEKTQYAFFTYTLIKTNQTWKETELQWSDEEIESIFN
ncbi:hypothetical protein SAMN02746066_03256 [Anaerosporobacter mobilis DSM 15930]|jgi:hypothetical protein|uniref:Replication-associated protein ORF2/G2P domain-containing protein n=1 Tax=Anaerosporobacter mobilis DSM 15930 TaxID=1120996 RepID=A0A1M7LGK2_9FIRM|nr:hypothetical protein [Anaerosporobacter mobilis]SHM77255.1 hypothetical protein SAMN02746066_03256 [Anaerosporobacter mobilis DSM 15930]